MVKKKFEKQFEVFYKLQYRIFGFFALWKLPEETANYAKIAHNIYFWHILLFWRILLDIACFIQIIVSISSLTELVKVFFMFATALAVMAKFLSMKLQNHKYIQLFALMQKADFMPTNPHEEKLCRKAMKLSRHVRNTYGSLSLLALGAVLINIFIDQDPELPLLIYMPISLDNVWSFRLVYLYESVATAVLCLMNIGFDSLGSSLFIYLKGQLEILANRLENIDLNSCKSHLEINLELKNCIRYYIKIVKLTKVIEALVSIPMSVQIFCSVLVLIANFYAMSFLSDPDDYHHLIKFSVYQSCMMLQIFILCYFANEVTLKSLDLSYALYKSDWISWNKENRKLVLLMMAVFDNPIRIDTINRCYSLNLNAFTSIVNSSYSYFALLKRMNS